MHSMKVIGTFSGVHKLGNLLLYKIAIENNISSNKFLFIVDNFFSIKFVNLC